ncbi:MAG: type II toxin-antitoxin system RelE/ParE family toxin [Bacteroidales bacterium]|nr:type II toxin-antitoxin system RelE/ParE family toxin [Bacteroidales bacterium]
MGEYESNEYRLLSFWDKTRSSIVVATHGFDKKTRKTPKQEIEHAESIRDNYYKTREENGD